ncbi:MAG: peptidoglycan synthetase, partial [Bacteroidales bacterium]|nr:peptidoglycan synthetase [Bacteroidales bacterium]
HTIKLKRLPEITKEQVKKAFQNPDIEVYTDSARLHADLLKINWQNKNLLMMSSGNFDGIDVAKLGDKITS